eukprot:m.53215 g.53215  ORF g.53215 m.53215 type:complete len:355 (+) comp15401_c0_seq1:63-1127(+)
MASSIRGSRSSFVPFIQKGLQTVLQDTRSRRLLWFVAAQLGVSLITAVVSLQSNSLALWTLMFLGLFDAGGLCIHMCSAYCAKLRPTAEYSFGYERVEVLLMFALGILLMLACVFSVKESVERLLEPVPHVDFEHGAHVDSTTPVQLQLGAVPLLALVSLLFHLLGMYFINKHTTLGRSMTRSTPRPVPLLASCLGESVTEKNAPVVLGVSCCLLVLGAAIFMSINPAAVQVDPLVAIVEAVFLVIVLHPIVVANALVLLQTAPSELSTALDKCLREISTCDGVLEYGSEHFWAISHGKLAGSLLVRVRRDANEASVLSQISQRLSPFVAPEHLTVQIVKDEFALTLSPARTKV